MVSSQEIIERTFYISLLHTAIGLGYSVNPDDYLPISIDNQKRFEADISELEKFIPIFGVGQNFSRGAKECPRITIESKAFYPGNMGLEKEILVRNDNVFQSIELPFETKSTTLDIHLVANNQADMRILHNIMYRSLPPRGYIKPYINDYEEWKESPLQKEGNIYIEVGNWYDMPNVEHGILEKIYSYSAEDSIVDELLTEIDIVPINDITLLLGPNNLDSKDLLTVNVHS